MLDMLLTSTSIPPTCLQGATRVFRLIDTRNAPTDPLRYCQKRSTTCDAQYEQVGIRAELQEAHEH